MEMTMFLSMPENAEAAMNFYQAVFTDASIKQLVRYPENMPKSPAKMTGKVLNGELEVQGQKLFFMDMDQDMVPALNWVFSIYTEFDTEIEFQAVFDQLSAHGTVMMGPAPIEGLKLVAWVTDKFGLTWQMVLA
ncbi:VOC family protein [Weissella viridescens]|uniref:VOC family protein n=1 Tax=Weissella viridescens TaxID=1629 RepID=A0A3P2RGS7_WEIVI|nr:VOC family protein [Weissella viridescens]RRG18775.1 VOC family protein [Weissella viridescens]